MKYPNIEAERVRARLSRSQLAERIGVKRDTYNAWIDGIYPIPANFLRKIVFILNCNADYLLAGDSSNERWKRYIAV